MQEHPFAADGKVLDDVCPAAVNGRIMDVAPAGTDRRNVFSLFQNQVYMMLRIADHMTHMIIWNCKQFCDSMKLHRIILSDDSLFSKPNFTKQ